MLTIKNKNYFSTVVKFLFIAFNSIPFFAFSQISAKKEIIQRMLSANDKLNTAKFTMYTEERMKDGKFVVTQRFVKLNTRPKQVYFYSIKPNPGTEILWKESSLEDKMTVSPGNFPYVTFKMKATSSLARKDSHHSIHDIGFEYLTGMMTYFQKNFGEKFYNYINIVDTEQWDNHTCIHIVFDFKDYALINYLVRKNENITTIAEKFHLNDYSILILNPSINGFEDVKEGQKINIPNFYNRKIEFFIDCISWLPIRQLIYDLKGLYERYEMKSFLYNPIFKPEEFTTGYKDYKF